MADITLISNEGAIEVSRPTNSDLSALQYYFVKLDTSEEVVACGANEKPFGILQNAPNGSSAEKIATVRIAGMSKLKISETVVVGNFLTSTSASKGEIADAANEEYGARALTSGENGDTIAVLIAYGEVTATDA